MRIVIEHQIVHRLPARMGAVAQMLRLTPATSDDQTVANWRIDVDCDARMRPGQDGFGNAVTMLYVEEPVEVVTITASGDILTSDAHGVVRGTSETLPPALFLRATEATPADAAIAAFAREAMAGTENRLAALHALNVALHRRFAVDWKAAPTGQDAAHAFEAAAASPCDLAHILCVAARSLGIPARYVSGFATLESEARAHCWVEAHVDGLGWIGFDPCIGLSPQDRHVRVAIALDAGGAAPVAGQPWSAGTAREAEEQ
ncbi:transglutaminase family protein [Sphingomonas sp.]|uniref:transglutaminase family protein n=1 Tax=Sphingomonas sp. TaxID=28214 RepID=UPI0031DE9B0D